MGKAVLPLVCCFVLRVAFQRAVLLAQCTFVSRCASCYKNSAALHCRAKMSFRAAARECS